MPNSSHKAAAGPPRFIIAAVLFAGALILAASALLGLALRENPKGAAGMLPGSAIGGPFHLVDQNGKPVDMPYYRAIGKFLRSGRPTEPAPIALRDLPPIGTSHAEQIIARSRNERSRPREAIEKKLQLFLGQRKVGAGGIGKPRSGRQRELLGIRGVTQGAARQL